MTEEKVSFTEELGLVLLSSQGYVQTSSALHGKIVGLLFSGYNSGNHFFPPRIVDVYNNLLSQGKRIEIVFIGSDQSKKDFKECFDEMPWLAVPWEESKKKDTLCSKFNAWIIPKLVMVDKDGSVIRTDGRTCVSADTEGHHFPWRHFDPQGLVKAKSANSSPSRSTMALSEIEHEIQRRREELSALRLQSTTSRTINIFQQRARSTSPSKVSRRQVIRRPSPSSQTPPRLLDDARTMSTSSPGSSGREVALSSFLTPKRAQLGTRSPAPRQNRPSSMPDLLQEKHPSQPQNDKDNANGDGEEEVPVRSTRFLDFTPRTAIRGYINNTPVTPELPTSVWRTQQQQKDMERAMVLSDSEGVPEEPDLPTPTAQSMPMPVLDGHIDAEPVEFSTITEKEKRQKRSRSPAQSPSAKGAHSRSRSGDMKLRRDDSQTLAVPSSSLKPPFQHRRVRSHSPVARRHRGAAVGGGHDFAEPRVLQNQEKVVRSSKSPDSKRMSTGPGSRQQRLRTPTQPNLQHSKTHTEGQKRPPIEHPRPTSFGSAPALPPQPPGTSPLQPTICHKSGVERAHLPVEVVKRRTQQCFAGNYPSGQNGANDNTKDKPLADFDEFNTSQRSHSPSSPRRRGRSDIEREIQKKREELNSLRGLSPDAERTQSLIKRAKGSQERYASPLKMAQDLMDNLLGRRPSMEASLAAASPRDRNPLVQRHERSSTSTKQRPGKQQLPDGSVGPGAAQQFSPQIAQAEDKRRLNFNEMAHRAAPEPGGGPSKVPPITALESLIVGLELAKKQMEDMVHQKQLEIDAQNQFMMDEIKKIQKEILRAKDDAENEVLSLKRQKEEAELALLEKLKAKQVVWEKEKSLLMKKTKALEMEKTKLESSLGQVEDRMTKESQRQPESNDGHLNSVNHSLQRLEAENMDLKSKSQDLKLEKLQKGIRSSPASIPPDALVSSNAASNSEVRYCYECGENLPKFSAKFCIECGAKQVLETIPNIEKKITKFCFECGEKIPRMAHYCTYCGINQASLVPEMNTR